MPRGPLPSALDRFLREARPAVVATLRPDGTPTTAPVWYDWADGKLLLSMDAEGPRASNLRSDPRVALTVLGSSWYDHVSVRGRVVELRDDPEFADLDRLSYRYSDAPYPDRGFLALTALVEEPTGIPGATRVPALGPNKLRTF